ncbi:MAG: ribbon-helix-helix protein, CopG family [Planctomycetota bacterium]|jgi:metal-responsive CopG/Arc/MetJ family transcriptional regulator
MTSRRIHEVRAGKIAISLPENLLRIVERERAKAGETRSAFFRRAVEEMLGRRERSERAEAYVQGYLRNPEPAAEVAAADAVATEALEEEEWE